MTDCLVGGRDRDVVFLTDSSGRDRDDGDDDDGWRRWTCVDDGTAKKKEERRKTNLCCVAAVIIIATHRSSKFEGTVKRTKGFGRKDERAFLKV